MPLQKGGTNNNNSSKNAEKAAQKSHKKIRKNIEEQKQIKRLEEDVKLIKTVMKGMDKLIACGGFHCREKHEELNTVRNEKVKKLINQVNIIARDQKGKEPTPFKEKTKQIKALHKEYGETMLELDEYVNYHKCLVNLCNGYMREFIDHMRLKLQNYYMSQKDNMVPERRRLLHQIFFAINQMSFRGDNKSKNTNATKMITQKDGELYMQAIHLFRKAMSL